MGIQCKQCSARDVEPEREHYATPVCFACLPPPKPLPKAYTQSHIDELTRERDEARAEVERLRALIAPLRIESVAIDEEHPEFGIVRFRAPVEHVRECTGAFPWIYDVMTKDGG